MGTIVFSENHQSLMIPYEEGCALCHPVTPQEEGAKWVYGLGRLPSDHIVVIGLGAGHHIAAMKDIHPHLKITVVERRDGLLQMFTNQYPELAAEIEVVCLDSVSSVESQSFYQHIVEEGSYVLSFRESWGLYSGFYTELFAKVTGRHIGSVLLHLRDMNMNLKARFNPLSRITRNMDLLGFELEENHSAQAV